MTDSRQSLRNQRAELMTVMQAMNSACGLSRRLAGWSALLMARNLDQVGDVEDTARLANVLAALGQAQAERGDVEGLTMSSAELLAVLCDLADAGDEELADGINRIAEGLDMNLVQYARAWSKKRKA